MSELYNIFSAKKVKDNTREIVVDYREKNSLVVSELVGRKMKVQFKQLPIADYFVNNIAIERKTITDLTTSVKNKRLFDQLNNLAQCDKRILLIEGLEDKHITLSSQIHENAIRGLLLTITMQYNIPLLFTYNEQDTAKYLVLLATISQKNAKSIRPSKKLKTTEEQIQFILEGFPSIGPTSAKKLLTTFKSLKNIINASQKDLEKVIGKKVEKIIELINYSSTTTSKARTCRES